MSSDNLAFYSGLLMTQIYYMLIKIFKPWSLLWTRELHKVYEWLTANKLTLNAKKSNFIIFHPHQKKINYQRNLKIFDNDSKTFFA